MNVTSGRSDKNCIISRLQGSINFVLIIINQEKSDLRQIGIKG
jgi:hypothetical protein